MSKRAKVFGASIAILFIVGIVGFLFVIFGAPFMGIGTVVYTTEAHADRKPMSPKPARVVHETTPSTVRAIYMSQCAAADIPFRNKILALIESTEINSVVIDVKDFTGTVSFNRTPSPGKEILKGKGCVVKDMKAFITTLHKKDIYVIGRITVFQDPLYASKHPQFAVQSKSKDMPWEDNNGLKYIDVGAKPFWKYIVGIALDARDIGFDELNFDYIRYPSDGKLKDMKFDYSNYSERPTELERFFVYLSQRLRVPSAYGFVPKLSADLFGMTMVTTSDLGIGQVLERTTPYFDYIDPMLYPSHFRAGFIGYKNPNNNAYAVVRYALDKAEKRVEATTTSVDSFAYTRIGTSTPAVYRKPSRNKNIIRPWLQDFNYEENYGKKKVLAQIKATYDAGMNSWMLWSPRNYYTKSALQQK